MDLKNIFIDPPFFLKKDFLLLYLFLFAALYLYRRRRIINKKVRAKNCKVMATVLESTSHRRWGSSVVLEYQYDGRSFTKTVHFHRGFIHFYEGDKVILFIDPNDPSFCLVDRIVDSRFHD